MMEQFNIDEKEFNKQLKELENVKLKNEKSFLLKEEFDDVLLDLEYAEKCMK